LFSLYFASASSRVILPALKAPSIRRLMPSQSSSLFGPALATSGGHSLADGSFGALVPPGGVFPADLAGLDGGTESPSHSHQVNTGSVTCHLGSAFLFRDLAFGDRLADLDPGARQILAGDALGTAIGLLLDRGHLGVGFFLGQS